MATEVYEMLCAMLRHAMQERPKRQGFVTLPDGSSAPCWVVHEAEQMRDQVNRIRARGGLDPVELEHILDIERTTAGHSDYASKYALWCATLALGETGAKA